MDTSSFQTSKRSLLISTGILFVAIFIFTTLVVTRKSNNQKLLTMSGTTYATETLVDTSMSLDLVASTSLALMNKLDLVSKGDKEVSSEHQPSQYIYPVPLKCIDKDGKSYPLPYLADYTEEYKRSLPIHWKAVVDCGATYSRSDQKSYLEFYHTKSNTRFKVQEFLSERGYTVGPVYDWFTEVSALNLQEGEMPVFIFYGEVGLKGGRDYGKLKVYNPNKNHKLQNDIYSDDSILLESFYPDLEGYQHLIVDKEKNKLIVTTTQGVYLYDPFKDNLSLVERLGKDQYFGVHKDNHFALSNYFDFFNISQTDYEMLLEHKKAQPDTVPTPLRSFYDTKTRQYNTFVCTQENDEGDFYSARILARYQDDYFLLEKTIQEGCKEKIIIIP